MTWDLVTATRWNLGPGPTVYSWSRDNPPPPHPMIVTENIVGSHIVGSPAVGTSKKLPQDLGLNER